MTVSIDETLIDSASAAAFATVYYIYIIGAEFPQTQGDIHQALLMTGGLVVPGLVLIQIKLFGELMRGASWSGFKAVLADLKTKSDEGESQ